MSLDHRTIPPPPTPTGRGPRQQRRQPTFPEERLLVRPWLDPVLDNLGHDPRSPYVERFWLAVLGPSCLFLLRRLAGGLERSPDGFELNPYQWAGELGLGMKGGKHGPFWRAIERGCRFHAAQRNGDLLVVRRRLPPLTARQVGRLPQHLGQAHHQWTAQQLQRPVRKTVATWSSQRSNSPSVGTVATEHGRNGLSQDRQIDQQ